MKRRATMARERERTMVNHANNSIAFLNEVDNIVDENQPKGYLLALHVLAFVRQTIESKIESWAKVLSIISSKRLYFFSSSKQI